MTEGLALPGYKVELTIEGKCREEGSEDIFKVRTQDAREQELRYDRVAGRITTDLHAILNHYDLPDEMAVELGCDSVVECFEKAFKDRFYKLPDTHQEVLA